MVKIKKEAEIETNEKSKDLDLSIFEIGETIARLKEFQNDKTIETFDDRG